MPNDLLVQVVESGKLPTSPGLFELINNHFISGSVRAGDAKLFWIFRVHFRFCFAEANRSVSLFVENLSITFSELGFGPDARYAVRHSDRKLRKTRDCFDVTFADGGSETLPEYVYRILGLLRSGRQ